MTSQSTDAPGAAELVWIVAGAALTLATIAALLAWIRDERGFVRDARRAASHGPPQERSGDESN